VTVELLSGWGRTTASAANVSAPADADAVVSAIERAGSRGLIARGLGRSYGDAAQNGGGDVLVTTSMDQVLEFDDLQGRIRVQAGAQLGALMRRLVPRGWWPAVTPGTRMVTVGGAIACDVHGKNHHRDGSFAQHVESLLLATPALGAVTVSPNHDADLFWATAGGMGLTGVIVEATLRLTPIETAYMRVRRWRCGDLDALLAALAASDATWRYSVAWVDCLARGRSLGRGVVEVGEHAPRQVVSSRKRPSRFEPRASISVPDWWRPRVIRRWAARAFNEAWYRRVGAGVEDRLVPAWSFFHPLDAVGGWNRLYGRQGFLQYQIVVPEGAESVLRQAMETIPSPTLAVLKRFGAADRGHLSFPMPGWTLAVDAPAEVDGLPAVLDRLDDAVAAAGGRVYLAKDSRLRPELLREMYPRLAEWQAVRQRVDPAGKLVSDLARRLSPMLR
jgi:decaprenylphospho-beta-D-ribofuranose 2-oxidase